MSTKRRVGRKGGFGADYIPQADLASTIGFAQIADAMPT